MRSLGTMIFRPLKQHGPSTINTLRRRTEVFLVRYGEQVGLVPAGGSPANNYEIHKGAGLALVLRRSINDLGLNL
jgi:hypothetical protein